MVHLSFSYTISSYSAHDIFVHYLISLTRLLSLSLLFFKRLARDTNILLILFRLLTIALSFVLPVSAAVYASAKP